MSKIGRLVVLEGPDSVGKTTLANALASELSRAGVTAEVVAFPGRTPGTLGWLVYRLHHDMRSLEVDDIAPAALQTAHVAAHLDAIERTILPKLRAGLTVVLDRYWWSTVVYGALAGVSRRILDDLVTVERRAWGALQPLVLFLVECAEPWRQSEDPASWALLVQEYRALAKRERGRTSIEAAANEGNDRDVAAGLAARVLQLMNRGAAEQRSEPCSARAGRRDRSAGVTPPSCGPLTRRLKSLQPSEVYDTFWRFAAERQEVYHRRLAGMDPAWTADKILLEHRFTNVYRASDRVSQYLIRHVQYEGEQDPADMFFRTLLFRLFNKVSTWQALQGALGTVGASEFSPERYKEVLDAAVRAGTRIYSAAYVMPPAPGCRGLPKHAGHIEWLDAALCDDLPARIGDAGSLQSVFEILRSRAMLGDFLAFQYSIDLNYSTLVDFSEMDFVVAGPGARSGIAKCFPDLMGFTEADIIRYVADRQEEEFLARGLRFRSLWSRPLQLVDCQNLFCEVDKYARIAHPGIAGASGRTRIKQGFTPAGPLDVPWFPPKWRLNERIAQCLEEVSGTDTRQHRQ